MKKIMILAAVAALAACTNEATTDTVVTDTGVAVEGPEVVKEPFKEPNNVNDENVKPK